MTPTSLHDQLMQASASRPVLQRRESWQTALESPEDDEATLSEAPGNTEVLAPRELGSSNPWRNHKSPTVEEVEDEALPSRNLGKEPINAAQLEEGRPSLQHDDSAQHVEVGHQQDATDSTSSAEVEQFLAALRIALIDPTEGAPRLRAMTAVLASNSEKSNRHSEYISQLLAAILMPPGSPPAWTHQMAGIRSVTANGVSTDPVSDAGSSAQNGPKREARVNTVRAAAESWHPQAIASDSTAKPQTYPCSRNDQVPSRSRSDSSKMSAKAAGKGREGQQSEESRVTRCHHDEEVPDPLSVQPRRRKLTEAQYKYELHHGKPKANGSDGYSSFAAPTSAWKAKQKPPQSVKFSRPAVQAKHSVSATGDPLAGSVGGRVKNGQERRSQSSTSSTPGQGDLRRRNVEEKTDHLKLQLNSGTSNTNKYRSQRSGASDHRAFAATVVAPVAVQRPPESTGHAQQQSTHAHAPLGIGIHNKHKAAAAPRCARPDPFGPKSDPTTRNFRPTHGDRHPQPRSGPMPPVRPEQQVQSNVKPHAGLAEIPGNAQRPIWERLAQQQNKRHAIYVKNDGTDEDAEQNSRLQDVINASNWAVEARVAEPPRCQVRLQDERRTPGPSSRGTEESKQNSIALEQDVSAAQTTEPPRNVPEEPRRAPLAVPVTIEGPSSAPPYRPESIQSASGILFTSRNDSNEARPDIMPEDAVPTEADIGETTRRDEVEIAAESASPEADAQKVSEAGKSRKDSVLMSSVRNAMSALKKFPAKMTGMKDSAWTAHRASTKQTSRRSLDSLLERPDVADLGDEVNGPRSLAGRSCESMTHDRQPLRVGDIESRVAPNPMPATASALVPGTAQVAARRVLPSAFRRHFRRRTTQPMMASTMASTLAPHAEEEEEQQKQRAPSPAPEEDVVELPATDRDGHVPRISQDSIRVWNEGGATWLRAQEYLERASSQQE
ncbi:hypothetical protein AC578_2700 [Pseudocercospora eumusae]|uniref:Uncharacterized protein n=1 Tax=Pseudocercospora eumusae TaxID=321146 RepID=A0A139HFY9_9PEZI|nr:hypothetical protein AC578_2700 [Pseudocercospora eumusae]KXT01317.1 hypothetical protein AC578_2700 [Pseudocercospora eumusae]